MPKRRVIRRAAAAVAALALIGFPLLANSTVAFADEGDPTFDSAEYSAIVGTDVTIGGTGTFGQTVFVSGIGENCGDQAVDDLGSWSCTFDTSSIGVGDFPMSVSFAGQDSAPATALLTVSADPGPGEEPAQPLPPTIDGQDEGGTIHLYSGTPRFSGGAYLPGDSDGPTVVVVTITGEGLDDPITCTTTVYAVNGDQGAWDCLFTQSLPDGDYLVSATQQPSWADAPSQPATAKLQVQLGGGGIGGVDCSASPGSLTVSYPSDIEIYLEQAGIGNASNTLGLCSGQPSAPPVETDFNSVGACLSSGEYSESGQGMFSGSPAEGCTASDLTAGTWVISYRESGSENWWDWYFTVPDSPTLTAAPGSETGRATFSGTGTPGDTITVVSSDGQSEICSATVGSDGNWACSADVGLGSKSYRAYQTDAASIGQSAYSSVTVLALSAPVTPATLVLPTPGPTPTPTPTPKPSPKPTATPAPVWNPVTFQWTFGADADGYHPGDPVVLSGAGLPSGALVEAEIHSTPVHLGTTIARPNGTFVLNVVIPHDTPAGKHEFWVTITPLDGGTSTVVQPAKITVVSSGGGSKVDDGGGNVPGAMGADRDDPGAPSSFTHGITTITHVIVNPIVIAVAGGIGLALLLLVAFPAELLNSTLESQYDRFSKVLPKVKLPWWERFATWVDKTPLVSASLMTLAASIIFGFADPGFGFDITSFRVVLGCFIALFIVGYLASIISGRILGRAWGFDTIMEVKPLTLILTVVGVVISRLLDFSPGFLIGLLLGMSLVGKRSKADQAKSTLVQTGVVFVMALLAWTAYSILSVTTTPDTFGSTLIFDTFVAITTEGMTGLFIGLLPLKFLDGQGLFKFSKLLWVGVYALVAFAFVMIVIPAADNWGDGGGSVGLWLSIVGAFAVVCVGIYLYFRFVAKPIPEEESEEPVERELVDQK